MISNSSFLELADRIEVADDRYGAFASAHEALGVCLEEWTELIAAVHANDIEAQKHEALDLAAALIRWHDATGIPSFRARSGARV